LGSTNNNNALYLLHDCVCLMRHAMFSGGYELVATEESDAKYSNFWLSCYWMSQKTRCCPAVSWYWGFIFEPQSV